VRATSSVLHTVCLAVPSNSGSVGHGRLHVEATASGIPVVRGRKLNCESSDAHTPATVLVSAIHRHHQRPTRSHVPFHMPPPAMYPAPKPPMMSTTGALERPDGDYDDEPDQDASPGGCHPYCRRRESLTIGVPPVCAGSHTASDGRLPRLHEEWTGREPPASMVASELAR